MTAACKHPTRLLDKNIQAHDPHQAIHVDFQEKTRVAPASYDSVKIPLFQHLSPISTTPSLVHTYLEVLIPNVYQSASLISELIHVLMTATKNQSILMHNKTT